jgi:hypothetical protein
MILFPYQNIILLIVLVASIYSVNSTNNEEVPQQQSSQSLSPTPIDQQHFSDQAQPSTRSSDPLPNEQQGIDQPLPDFPAAENPILCNWFHLQIVG